MSQLTGTQNFSQFDESGAPAPKASGGMSTAAKVIIAVLVLTVVALIIALIVVALTNDGGGDSGNGSNSPSPVGAQPTAAPSPFVVVTPPTPVAAPTPVPTLFSPTPPAAPTPDPTPFTMAPSPPLPTPSGAFNLPPSADNELLVAQSRTLSPSGDPIILARSYDNGQWELMPDAQRAPGSIGAPGTVDVQCASADSSQCNLVTAELYDVVAGTVPAELAVLTPQDQAARVATQMGFGSSTTDVELLITDYTPAAGRRKRGVEAARAIDVASFLRDQMDEDKTPPSLLRDYVRKRMNPRVLGAAGAGSIRPACSIGSRWLRYAFTPHDIGRTVDVTQSGGRYRLTVSGKVRTEALTSPGFTRATLCDVNEGVNAEVKYSTAACTQTQTISNFSNPSVEFASRPSGTGEVWEPTAGTDVDLAMVPNQPHQVMVTAVKRACPADVLDHPPRFLRFSNQYFAFDRRLSLTENTLSAPAQPSPFAPLDTVLPECPNLPRNFMNKDKCQRRASCSGLVTNSHTVTLNDNALRAFFEKAHRYVYRVRGLRLVDRYAQSPCDTEWSRWQKIGPSSGCSETNIDAGTKTFLLSFATPQLAAQLANETNPNVFDLWTRRDTKLCKKANNQIGMTMAAGGYCLRHVHPHEFDIRDFSAFVENHDGNEAAHDAGRRNPIARWAEDGVFEIAYPADHKMDNWRNRQARLAKFGVDGDRVDFDAMPSTVQTRAVAAALGASQVQSNELTYEVCGSPGETANDGTLGNRYMYYDDTPTPERTEELDWKHDVNDGKRMAWLNMVLNRDRVPAGKKEDLLRQRVAWALSQIIVLGESGLSLTSQIEAWANWYDIFVRHAFGNYRDILKEVTYSPMMTRYLSFYENKARASSGTFPDENYAREIMQLFTIGLWMQDDRGRYIPRPGGQPDERIDAYDHDDIVDMARVWTGFDDRTARQGYEQDPRTTSYNLFDPSMLRPEWHDYMPKADTLGGYIGDGYVPCVDQPARHWLSKGARFELTGEHSIEGDDIDLGAEREPTTIGRRPRFEPNPASSALYAKLCAAPGAAVKCAFPAEVVLDANLPCDGVECNAGRVRTVKIVDQVDQRVRYYTYIRESCVRMAFFEGGQVIKSGSSKQCANPRDAVSHPACCRADRTTSQINSYGPECLFLAEAMTYAEAKSRCEAQGFVLCTVDGGGPWSSWERSCARSVYMWVDSSKPAGACSLQVQVHPIDGRVELVDTQVVPGQKFWPVLESSNDVFRVHWDGGATSWPLPTANACGAGCAVVPAADGNDSCKCDVEVHDAPVFAPTDAVPQSMFELARALPLGAPNPASFAAGEYTKCATAACTALPTDVSVWLRTGTAADSWPMSAIFELPPHRAGGRVRFRFNRLSKVFVGGTRGDYTPTRSSFRNPPSFMPLAGEQVSNSEWNTDRLDIPAVEAEVDATLDFLFEHNNTAVFVAYRMIQRLVTSNPSPRYLESVVRAFRSGTYNGVTYSGRYGDLGATVAAVFLDQEARSPSVEADVSAGQLREPLLKLVHLLRALEFKTKDGREIMMPDLFDQIGQTAFKAPSVFGFYLPEFQPSGRLGDLNLVGPEFEIATTPRIVQYMNGISSLVDNGLTSCDNGFGYDRPSGGRSCPSPDGRKATADGEFTWRPPASVDRNWGEQVIDYMSLLLTAGRLAPTTRARLIKEYEAVLVMGGSTDDALKRAIELFAYTQEFNTNTVRLPVMPRPPAPPEVPSQKRPYKALVIVFKSGGADTFNMLVPYDGCTGVDLYQEYSTVRTGAAVSKNRLRPINTPGQVCSRFGVHNQYKNLHQMYQDGEALFLANIGALVEPVTKADYLKQSGRVRRFPPSLFAHNIMQRSMHNLFAQNANAKGVLGRTVNALLSQAQPYKSELYSLSGSQKMLDGSLAPNMIDRRAGVIRFKKYQTFKTSLREMTANRTAAAVGDKWAQTLERAVEKTEEIGAQMGNIATTTPFGTDSLSQQMQQVAKLIRWHTSQTTEPMERAVFVTVRGSYDTHGTFDLDDRFGDPDSAIGSLKAEMQAIGHWNDVAVLSVSDFGRTLTSNGAGTDHAWAGHHYLAGGAVSGGKVLGKYPTRLNENGDDIIGRGRVLPSSSWEHVWKGLVQWLGVEDSQLPEVLPNLANFPANEVWDKATLFK